MRERHCLADWPSGRALPLKRVLAKAIEGIEWLLFQSLTKRLAVDILADFQSSSFDSKRSELRNPNRRVCYTDLRARCVPNGPPDSTKKTTVTRRLSDPKVT